MVTIIGVKAVLQTKHHKLGPDVKLQVYDQFTLPIYRRNTLETS